MPHCAPGRRLKTVQREVTSGDVHSGCHRRRHDPGTLQILVHPVTQMRVLEGTPHYRTQGQQADHLIVTYQYHWKPGASRKFPSLPGDHLLLSLDRVELVGTNRFPRRKMGAVLLERLCQRPGVQLLWTGRRTTPSRSSEEKFICSHYPVEGFPWTRHRCRYPRAHMTSATPARARGKVTTTARLCSRL